MERLRISMCVGAALLLPCAVLSGQTAPVANQPASAPAPRVSPDTVVACPAGTAQLRDREFASRVFGGNRQYRIFLPADYDSVQTRYPVIYYFHGHSDRYTLEDYDHGQDTVPKICRYVADHPVIVVAMDGYVAQEYTGFYGGDPYDVRRTGGRLDFGEYFLEQVRAVDANYRTLTSRRYRATSGLSMGGFMSLYLSARFPDVVGSSSAFNPGPEFYVGGKGRQSLWRPKDHVLSFEHTPVRLVMVSGDFIRRYTEETRDAFARTPSVDFEFRQDEYPRHWATSIAETFDFHMRAFADPGLDQAPAVWNYSSAFNTFEVWGYHVQAELPRAALVYLEHVSRAGLGVETRQWAPDGPSSSCPALDVTTPALYRPGAKYRIFDFSMKGNTSTDRETVADRDGRLSLATDCGGHEFGISGPGIDDSPLVLLPVAQADFLRIRAGEPVPIPIRLWNPSATARHNVHVELTSDYPTAEILKGKAIVSDLRPGEMVDLGSSFQVRFVAGDEGFSRVRLLLNAETRSDDEFEASQPIHAGIDVMVAPADLPPPVAIEILDGRTKTFPIFWQGRHGGGRSFPRTVTEGTGNGDGVLEPGERATVWIQVPQGLDPFDKGNWCRAKVYSGSPLLTEASRIEEDKREEFTSGQNLTSVIELSPTARAGATVNAILDCETYSFEALPDVRFGTEPLSDPFQIHKHYLYSWTWQVKQ
jgi:hypothetical protein